MCIYFWKLFIQLICDLVYLFPKHLIFWIFVEIMNINALTTDFYDNIPDGWLGSGETSSWRLKPKAY